MENVKLQPLKSGIQIEEITTTNKITAQPNESLSSEQTTESSKIISYDKSALLKPSEVKQYLFKVKYEDIEKEKKPLTVGKLDISWRYSMGECGRLQTHPLEQPVGAID